MRYLLNERSIIDVYVEHVCDEPDILYMLECGSIPCDAVDEINDIGPSVVNKDVVYEDDEFFDAVHSEGEINDEDEEVHDEEEEVHDDEDEIDDEEVHDDEVEVHDDEQNDEDEFLDALLSDVDDEEVVEAIVMRKMKMKRSMNSLYVQMQEPEEVLMYGLTLHGLMLGLR
ncbi:hypothetical protein SLEP1_g42122 [Rubroshorea leprosula]|uniref:Uncharacterized protein n=1 Tax=Rubroshorea leprosula TaxID=152421 RepID=A0AAV5LA57_9ROSI|nr:hypothetical protein SLEP1_g42122 [Rubroshorea leprosula]